jgi:hypothetical protein
MVTGIVRLEELRSQNVNRVEDNMPSQLAIYE